MIVKNSRGIEMGSTIGQETLPVTETTASGPDNKNSNVPENSSGQSPALPGWDKLLHLTDDNYADSFRQYSDIFIMFHAKWCGHCATIKPIFVELAHTVDETTANTSLENQSSTNVVVTLAACDTDLAPTLVDELQLITLPTFKYVRNGKAITEYGGERNKESFVEFLQRMKEQK